MLKEKMDDLKPCLKKGGKITAANTTGLKTMEQRMLVLMDQKSKKENYEILAEIKGIETVGLDPNFMGLGLYIQQKNFYKKII